MSWKVVHRLHYPFRWLDICRHMSHVVSHISLHLFSWKFQVAAAGYMSIYVACVNQKCKSVYFSDNLEDIKECTDDLECIDCGAKWRMCGQRTKTNALTYFANLIMEKIYNNNTYSDLYKVLFAQQCPSCKVMIVRSEGCKFMECGKCKFQFCWLCLSEFYTEYHYYYSSCPLRIIPIYGIMALRNLQ